MAELRARPSKEVVRGPQSCCVLLCVSSVDDMLHEQLILLLEFKCLWSLRMKFYESNLLDAVFMTGIIIIMPKYNYTPSMAKKGYALPF
jgi:hypothetical protein